MKTKQSLRTDYIATKASAQRQRKMTDRRGKESSHGMRTVWSIPYIGTSHNCIALSKHTYCTVSVGLQTDSQGDGSDVSRVSQSFQSKTESWSLERCRIAITTTNNDKKTRRLQRAFVAQAKHTTLWAANRLVLRSHQGIQQEPV